MSFMREPNALKRKSEKKTKDVTKLEGALSLLEKKKKLNWRSLILKACVMLILLHYFVENLQVFSYVSFIIYFVLKFNFFFHSLFFRYSLRRLVYWLRWLLFPINLNRLKWNLLNKLRILLKHVLYVYLF